MVPQEQQRLVPEIGDDAFPLVQVQGDALVIMIGEALGHQQGVLADRQQAVLLRRDADTGIGVKVHDAQGVLPRGMDRRVDGETRRIDEVGRLLHDVAVQIDLDEG